MFVDELIQIPINVHRDYIFRFYEYPNLKIVNITINNDAKNLWDNDKEIQDLFEQYRKKKYSIGIHISGASGNIYKTLGKIIDDYIKENM
jgi:hypothetical protein